MPFQEAVAFKIFIIKEYLEYNLQYVLSFS